MSIDAAWYRRKPGLVPPALVRAAVDAVSGTSGALVLDFEGEDFGAYGATALVHMEDLGPILVAQPDGPEDALSMQISSSMGVSRKRWGDACDVADELAAALGMRYEDDPPPSSEPPPSSPAADLTAVRVELSLRPTVPVAAPAPAPRFVAEIAGERLAAVPAAGLSAFAKSTLEAVAWALELAGHAGGPPSLDDLARWVEDYEVSFPEDAADEGGFHVDTDGARLFVSLDGDDTVEILAWPGVEMDPMRALGVNEADLTVSALALDDDGDLRLRSIRPRAALAPETFAKWLDEVFDELEVVREKAGAEGDEEPEGEEG
ncbi:MAG: hypothetical protein QM820_40715 [Minicystis sp.]